MSHIIWLFRSITRSRFTGAGMSSVTK
jgi:hypothetical protein